MVMVIHVWFLSIELKKTQKNMLLNLITDYTFNKTTFGQRQPISNIFRLVGRNNKRCV